MPNWRSGATVGSVGQLQQAVAEHPLRERLAAQLALALYRSGRQADALRALSRARHTLADELGLDPGPELQELEAQILSHDRSLVAPERAQRPALASQPAPTGATSPPSAAPTPVDRDTDTAAPALLGRRARAGGRRRGAAPGRGGHHRGAARGGRAGHRQVSAARRTGTTCSAGRLRRGPRTERRRRHGAARCGRGWKRCARCWSASPVRRTPRSQKPPSPRLRSSPR